MDANARSASDDELAIERYRYLLRTAPPETLEAAHREAFEQLTPDQRRRVLEGLAREVDPAELRSVDDSPDGLARLATRAELRRPGTMERAFGGQREGGWFGGMFGGNFFGMLAGAFIGTSIANAIMPMDMGGDADAAAGDSAMADGSDGGGAGEGGWDGGADDGRVGEGGFGDTGMGDGGFGDTGLGDTGLGDGGFGDGGGFDGGGFDIGF
jgi:hypothetical protein